LEILPLTSAIGISRRPASPRRFGHSSVSAITIRVGFIVSRNRRTAGPKSNGMSRTEASGMSSAALFFPVAVIVVTSTSRSGTSFLSSLTTGAMLDISPTEAAWK
jgi:hypothetical protein